MDAEANERLKGAVLAAAREERGHMRLRCAEAFRIAEEFGVKPGVVGGLCSREGIRISRCQLGCFR